MKSMDFEPGLAVEVSIDGGHSWHSGTIIRRMYFGTFLVHSKMFIRGRSVVRLDQLRRPLRHRKFESSIEENSFGIGCPSDNDMISELPDIVLIHILNFMDTKEAVRTCILSKRWKDLCKRVTSLSFPRTLMGVGKRKRIRTFRKFASWVKSNRDDSYSVMNLSINDWAEPQFLDKVIKYALIHDVQNLTLGLHSRVGPHLKSLALIFRCHTLTSLMLFNFMIILPKSLHLPALKSLHLEQVEFTTTGDDRAEPFSNCPVLDTLVLGNFSLRDGAKVLSISSSTLSTLTIFANRAYKIMLSTPNLGSCTICDSHGYELSSECNLFFLREVNIITSWNVNCSIIMGWLQVLANVKILTLNVCAFLIMFRRLSESLPMRQGRSKFLSSRPKCQPPSFAILIPELQPPSFARLESLKVRKHSLVTNGKINSFVECLLQNSPMAKNIKTTVVKGVLGWPEISSKRRTFLPSERWSPTLYTLL